MIRKVPSTNWFEAEASPPPPDRNAPVVVEAVAELEVEPLVVTTVEPEAPSRRRRRAQPELEVEPAEVITVEPEARSRRRRGAQPASVAAPPTTEPPRPSAELPRRPTRSRAPWRRIVSIAVFAAIIAFWVIELRPTWMGGSASVLTVRGQSMEPSYSYGDIIIAHRHGSYGVGDIIAFAVPEGNLGAGTVVIHRIIGGDATTGFITQGDNNPDADDWHPVPADILGSASWRIPMVGRLFSALRTVPGIAAVSGILAALLVVLGTGSPEPRERRRPERADGEDPAPVVEAPAPAMPMEPAADPKEDLSPPPIADPVSPPLDDPDHEVVGEYWGDLEHLAAILRERARPNAVFDDVDEVSRPLV